VPSLFKCIALPVESITVGLDALAFDPNIIVIVGLLWFGINTGSLLDLGGTAINFQEFVTVNGTLSCAFVLLSMTKVTVCGSGLLGAHNLNNIRNHVMRNVC
jgi:hypothetical protein